MADREFKQGDTVKLKSGGPLMVVAKLSPWVILEEKGTYNPEYVKCTWFDQVTSIETEGIYHISLLTLVLPEDPKPHRSVGFHR